MKKINGNNKRAVFGLFACLVLWALGSHALTSPSDKDHVIRFLNYTPEAVELMKVAETGDPNEPNELTWAEMAAGTYFMIFIDVSDSMKTSDVDAIHKATELFTEYLADEAYGDDFDQASKYVIVEEVINERYLQHMAAWNQDHPEVTRYVNIFLMNEADQDYYSEGSILYPTDKFIDDLNGNQERGGFVYGLRNELKQRTFSIGKVYNIGGKQGNNIGGFQPVFAVHLYCAFNNVGDFADMNLGDLALSYDNIESGLTAMGYLQYLIDVLDYSAAYISEEETDDCPVQMIRQRGKTGQKKGSGYLI